MTGVFLGVSAICALVFGAIYYPTANKSTGTKRSQLHCHSAIIGV
jgi:hypothetical protein